MVQHQFRHFRQSSSSPHLPLSTQVVELQNEDDYLDSSSIIAHKKLAEVSHYLGQWRDETFFNASYF